MPDIAGDITELLHRWRDGSSDAEQDLFRLVLPDLQKLAHYLMRRERPDHSMQATELVNQIYLKLVAAKHQDWQSRKHFFAIAARAMRRFLIDHARGRPRVALVPIDGMESFLSADSDKVEQALTVDELLTQLSVTNAEWCQVVEVKYFLGLTDEEAAEVLGMRLRTMQRMWRDARQWLYEQAESKRGQTSSDQTERDRPN